MTVKELIEKLQELDPELHVFIPGYEGGFHHAGLSDVKNICLNVNEEWYYGPHELTEHVHEDDRPKYKRAKGVVL